MKLEIDDEVFASSGFQVEVHFLFSASLGDRFRVFPIDETGPNYQAWLGDLPAPLRDEFELLVEFSQDREAREPSRRRVHVALSPKPDWNGEIPILSPKDAVRLVNKPFSIVLENRVTDRDFLLAVARPRERKRIRDLEEDGLLQFENGGGLGTMIQALRSELETCPDLQLRKFYLFDSDARRPNAPSETSERLRQLCGSRIPHHQLDRRAIENYLPPDSLRGWVFESSKRRKEKGRLVATFAGLDRPQQHHFNLKSGFTRESPSDVFAGTDTSNLERGFGDDIAKLFSSGHVTPEALDRYNVYDEIDAVVSRMIAEIC